MNQIYMIVLVDKSSGKHFYPTFYASQDYALKVCADKNSVKDDDNVEYKMLAKYLNTTTL